MSKKAMNYVAETIENEGFDYAFRHYSDFTEVADPVFHQLRTAYEEAANALENYVKERSFLGRS